MRASEAFPSSSGHSLWGSAISPNDVNQGSLGNCWFLAAASAIAEVPGRMEDVFLNNGLNSHGWYGVKFYPLGVEREISIDDYLPVRNHYGSNSLIFSKPSDDGSLWMAILEKAFSKYHGNYQHIAAGVTFKGVATMTGAPYYDYDHAEYSESQLWDILSRHDAAGDIMTAGTHPGSDTTTDESGIVQGHAYTIIGVRTLSNGQ